MALCAMVMAAALSHVQPCLGYGPGNPSVIIDFSAIDQALAARRTGAQADQGRHRLADPRRDAGLPDAGLRAADADGSPSGAARREARAPLLPPVGSDAFYALFPPPPPVPAEAPADEAAPSEPQDEGTSAAEVSLLRGVAALPVARPAVRPAVHAAPVPAVALVMRPARQAAPQARLVASRLGLAPAAKPARRQESVDAGRRVRLRLPYPAFGTQLSPSAEAQLDALVAEVGSNDRLRLRLAAYADAGTGSVSKARRLSLARALSVRSFLIERGIRAGRIDLRALGHTAAAAEADRVDVVVADK